MRFSRTAKFDQELSKLTKKYPSLSEDLAIFQKTLPAVELNNNKRYAILHDVKDLGVKVIKTRLMVRCLKGSSKIRIIFVFLWRDDVIDLIEIYAKNVKDREDANRIREYLAMLKLPR